MATLKLSSADHNRDSVGAYCKLIPNTKDEMYAVAMHEANNDVELLNFTKRNIEFLKRSNVYDFDFNVEMFCNSAWTGLFSPL